MTGTNGTGDGGQRHELCNNRLTVHWLGILGLAALSAVVGIHYVQTNSSKEAIVIALATSFGTVIGQLGGHLGQRTAQQQSTGTGAIVNNPPAVDPTQPTAETATGGVE
jgi:hypothetical protein